VRSPPAGSTRTLPRPSVTWIIEISSQVIFSNSATVYFEVIVGRDEKSTELGAGSIADLPSPGDLHENAELCKKSSPGKIPGVYSDSISLKVDDTSTLWSTPPFPTWDKPDRRPAHDEQHFAHGAVGPYGATPSRTAAAAEPAEAELPRTKKRKKVHFVVLTHGLHSNLGADMLYMKESIDAAAKQARQDAKVEREQRKKAASSQDDQTSSSGTERPDDDDVDEDEDEMVIVRGFPGNVVRTERGIQYLGKRLAKYVLLVTYPDQPYLPVKSPRKRTLTRPFGSQKVGLESSGRDAHHGSVIHRHEPKHKDYPYQITSISFVGHSLGGLVQTYAIAYIQKHSPEFFDLIRPVNFVALASPFLGLSNENPLYVKFALDFGLVGRTGQDLGLSWTAPSRVRSGWGAMIGGLGNDSQKSQREPDPGSKPLLRILPTGPAHNALKKFRNRTVYSNVVNDGIVPLRTSCLLFLDWRGLDRVEKARRENGLVGTVAEWGWAELTGANSRASPRIGSNHPKNDRPEESSVVPQPSEINIPNDSHPQVPAWSQWLRTSPNAETPRSTPAPSPTSASPTTGGSSFNSFLSIFRLQTKPKNPKTSKMIRRSQTLSPTGEENEPPRNDVARPGKPSGRARGDSLYDDNCLQAPPKTTIFESAGDVLNPPLPPTEYILDPSVRARTIFHDRIYHPDDIPPPPPAKQRTFFSVSSSNLSGNNENSSSGIGSDSKNVSTKSGMKVEEKIARAYHRDLSWRKVLVSLEPDAHNNIIVRRKFANAYGWPVVKHLVDTHFGHTEAAQTADAEESGVDRAMPVDVPSAERGNQVTDQDTPPDHSARKQPSPAGEAQGSYNTESEDEVPEMTFSAPTSPGLRSASGMTTTQDEYIQRSASTLSQASSSHSKLSRQDSARWTDRYFEEDADDDEDTYARFDEYTRSEGDLALRIAEASSLHAPGSSILDEEVTSSPAPASLSNQQENVPP
jgi:hypothetical protein